MFIKLYKVLVTNYFVGNNNIIMVKDKLNNTIISKLISKDEIKEYRHFIKLAKVDTLTGIYNEYALEEIMDNYKENYTFIFVDINKLKSINICYGQLQGDKVLKEFATYLTDFCKKVKFHYKFCRYESDEFIICIGTIIEDEIKKVIDYLKSFKNKEAVYEEEIKLRIVAIKNKYGVTVKKLISYVEYLLEDKNLGLDKDYYKIIQNEENLRRYYCMAYRLNKGIKYLGEIGELYVVFQPQFQVKTNTIKGYEVLCRWNNEELGNINPKEFLDFAKCNNRMYELDLFVFEEAFKFQKYLKEINIDQSCSINVSISTLKKDTFIKDICELVNKYGIDMNTITIEMVEEAVLDNGKKIKNILNELKHKGINISIDDFGTGYSSLSRLYSAPFDELKIPREFIKDTLIDKRQIKILKIISTLAKSLNLNTVVEGVETIEQYDLIKKLGFKYSQGYFHSKPLNKNEYIEFLNRFIGINLK
ncbi:MAG: GGDEF and EAL domain-containing protein [Sarcina sp.]